MNKFIKDMIPYGIMERYYSNKRKNSIPKHNVNEPVIFNAKGEQMRVFYLQDHASKYAYSFTAGRASEKIFWDRDNLLLPIHFYTHEEIFNTQDTAQKKFGYVLEPESCKPELYKRLYESPELVKEFDAIFTHSAKLLDMYDNAKLYLGQGAWYGTDKGGGVLDSEAYKKKDKGISMVSSNKTMLESHKLRISIAKEMKKHGVVDTFGAFDGGPSIKVADALTRYRYSIALENEISDFYFTEKILNCFASMTIPVYAGANRIGDFFNMDGIIRFDKYTSTEEMLKTISICTPEYYEEHIDAVIDNYNRVQKLLCMDDYIFEEYKSLFDI